MAESPMFYTIDGPLDAPPGEGQLRAANLQGFGDYVRRRHADPQRILGRYGIDSRALIDPDAHVPAKALVDTFEYCSELFGDSLFGLHLAQVQDADVFGCLNALARAAPDLGTALEALVRYMPIVHSPEATPLLVQGQNVAELRWSTMNDLGVNDQANLQAVLLQMKLLRQLGGRQFEPRYVELAVDLHPRDLAEIEDVLACRVQTGRDTNAIGFASEHLGAPLASANRLIYRLLGGYLDRVRSANRISLAQRVRDYIRGDLPRGTCSIERCGKKLGMPARTLQARLAEEDASFSGLLEEVRIVLSKAYLRRPESTLDEVAEWLGYGEQTSFGRAFKRWTGTTPQKYRAALQARRLQT